MPAIDSLMDEIAAPDYQPMTNYEDLKNFLFTKQFKNRNNDWYASWSIFRHSQMSGHRLGQVFMNVLPEEFYTKLVDTPIDPFNEDSWESIYRALDYLILSET